ncbi:M23 family metallopeptidase [Thiorhodococcus mannitoliphagus]|uniref:M23 family metallopeptidase n=1 Tax=Thiorhodococcus mannitoliphagus TaxID=329406 RepID=A0A6P1DV08_9GAMM|nr:M23 family metallopeptidase [Thiorhodococcus mannitoliphagus]NEX19882.1 M23 family metallopeptidase [Thiorhodococcus mannitoliphagus]
MPGCTEAIGRLILVVLIAGTPMTIAPLGAAGQGADPLAVVPRIRLITRDQDSVVKAVRVIRAEPTPKSSMAVGRPSGDWLWPVRGRLTSGFGIRRHPIMHAQRFHAGVDLAAPIGTPVRAVAAGRVRTAGRVGGYGGLVELNHGDGWTTRYGHLQQTLVASAQRVEAGEIIATVGSTGLTTGPHLHVEIRRHGQPIDPLTRLAPRSAQRLALRPRASAGAGG